MKPTWPIDIWPQYPVSILSPCTLMMAMPIMVMMVRTLSLRKRGQTKRRTRKARSIPHWRLVRKMAMS